MTPRAALVLPEIQARRPGDERLEADLEFGQRSPGRCRIHLVLHGDVRPKALGVLTGQPVRPPLSEVGLQPIQGGTDHPVGDAVPERHQLGDGDIEGRPIGRVRQIVDHRRFVFTRQGMEQAHVCADLGSSGREQATPFSIEAPLDLRFEAQGDYQRVHRIEISPIQRRST